MMRWLPLCLIIVILALVFYFRLYEYVNFTALQHYHQQLTSWTKHHYTTVVVLFMLCYVVMVAISFPGAALLTITGGFLFGIGWGTVYTVLSSTVGACFLFIAIKLSFGDWLLKRAKGWVHRLEKGFNDNAFNYLLFLRLIPVFPFWVINIVPALLRVRLRVFFWATLLGVIPGSFVYTSVGNGLGQLMALGQRPNLRIIFHPSIFIPILGLAILALIPVIYRRFKQSKLDD